VVIDTLHLFLRVSDNLIGHLIRELKVCDSIEKKIKYSDGFCREKYRNVSRYETFLQELGIPILVCWKRNKTVGIP
jgi:hypothetical protein